MKNETLILLGILLLAILMISGWLRNPEKPAAKTVTITVTTSLVWDQNKPFKEIDLSNKSHLRQGEITVYFELNQRRLAQEVTQALQDGWHLVAKRLGIALGAFEVALIALSETERAEIGGIYIRRKVQVKHPLEKLSQQTPVLPKPPFPVEVASSVKSLKEAGLETRLRIYDTMPHEALHRVIQKALEKGLDQGWKLDRQVRGLEEGLAEYIGHIVTQKFDPAAHQQKLEGRRKQVEAVLQGHVRPTYDLTQEFLVPIEVTLGKEISREYSKDVSPEELAGYAVSLAFWLQIVQKHGEGVIKEFWQRLSQRGFPNAQEAARILSELTGEDIWAKLQKMDLRGVLQTLERAAGMGL